MSTVLTLNGNVLTNSGNVLKGEISNVQIEASKSATVSQSGTLTINPSTGYGAMEVATVTTPAGVVVPASTISGTDATVSTGANTLTLSKSVSNTPTVSTSGFVTSGTSGNSSVSLTANVTTQAAQTIHPSTSDQTIASGTYTTGAQTIKAVTTTNLSAENIVNGVTVKVGDSTDDDCVASVTGTATTSLLPDGYTQYDYIESDGTNSYMDIGIVPNANTKVECTFALTKYNNYQGIFGCNNFEFGLFQSNYFKANSGTSYTFSAGYNVNWNKVIMTPTSVSLTQIPTSTTSSGTMTSTTTSVTMALFTTHNTDHSQAYTWFHDGNVAISSFKVWSSTTLVMDLIPCTNSSDVAGFYDIENNTFYPHTGSTALLAKNFKDENIQTTRSYTISSSGTTTLTPASGYRSMYNVSVTASGLTLPTSASASSSGTSKATIYPNTADQYLNIPTGYNGTASYYTFPAVTTTNLTASNIKSGVTVEVGDSADPDRILSVTGTLAVVTNFVTGTFTTNSSYGTQNVTIPYTGSGYPIAVLVYVTGGPYNNGTGGNSTWYDLVQRYAVGVWGCVKSRANVAPTWTGSGEANYGNTWAVYKNSTSTATTYAVSQAMTTNTFTASTSSASASAAQTVRFKGSSTAMQVYVSNTSYGLARSTNYTYYIVYSS